MHGARVCEPFGFVARFSVVDVCFESEDTLDVLHNLVNTPLEGCCYEYFDEESSSLCFSYAFHVSATCSQPLFPPNIL